MGKKFFLKKTCFPESNSNHNWNIDVVLTILTYSNLANWIDVKKVAKILSPRL